MSRRPPAVVLWGGRPGIDLQAGSLADQRRAERLRRIAAVGRASAKALIAYRRAFVQMGRSAADAIEAMRPAVEALNRLDTPTERLKRAAAAMDRLGKR